MRRRAILLIVLFVGVGMALVFGRMRFSHHNYLDSDPATAQRQAVWVDQWRRLTSPIAFDRACWLKVKEGQVDEETNWRNRMADDVLRRVRPGMSRKDVVKMLGSGLSLDRGMYRSWNLDESSIPASTAFPILAYWTLEHINPDSGGAVDNILVFFDRRDRVIKALQGFSII